MILVRVRYSLSRDRLRDKDAGLREPGPVTLLPPRGSAFTRGMVTDRSVGLHQKELASSREEPVSLCAQRKTQSVSGVKNLNPRPEMLLMLLPHAVEGEGCERGLRTGANLFTTTHTHSQSRK